MSNIMIHDLALSKDLDTKAMANVRGGAGAPGVAGNSWLAGLGPAANVNININQDIKQLQNVEVNALNNVGSIGPGFGPLNLNVSPNQWVKANVAV
jgi:hypothetical protein